MLVSEVRDDGPGLAATQSLKRGWNSEPYRIFNWMRRRALDLPKMGCPRVNGFNISVSNKVPVIESQNALDAMHPHRRY